MLTTYSLKMPHAVYGGENAMDNITAILKSNGVKRVAIFTDKGIEGAGLFALPEAAVKASGADYYVLDDLPAEPSYMAVQKLVDQFKASGADMIVACGGGSVMDAAKLASVLVTDEYGVKELLDEPARAKKCVPIILIPTTAGTGAEVTPNAIVAVPEKELKVGIVNENMIADYVILDTRMQNGIKMNCQVLDFVAEATDAALFVEARIRQEGMQLVYQEPPEPYPVWADPARLRQVFVNLFDNAIKYSEPGGTIFLTLSRTPVTVSASIRDQGRGIAPDDLEKVKQKFFKAKNSVRGSGIGLAVVDEIVQTLGGRFDIASALGCGTTVTVTLPVYHPGQEHLHEKI